MRVGADFSHNWAALMGGVRGEREGHDDPATLQWRYSPMNGCVSRDSSGMGRDPQRCASVESKMGRDPERCASVESKWKCPALSARVLDQPGSIARGAELERHRLVI